MKILVSWIGQTDLNAASGEERAGLGPVGQAVTQRSFDLIVLLSNYPKPASADYVTWVERHTNAAVDLILIKLSGPTNLGEIYQAVTEKVGALLAKHGESTNLTFHLSPGTPAMAAVWIIVAKTRYGAELIESSKQQGVRTANVPFDISAEFVPEVYRRADRDLAQLSAGVPQEATEFSNIVHRSPVMRRVIEKAQKVAPRSVPILIEGESGTGKEMLARAIHRASPRRDNPFIAVNCGAISHELAESEFFGHKKGAFTGATSDRSGHFETADGGTLFLDEIGELSPELQVKLLRVLQEQQVVRVGTTMPVPVDVRIIAATNRTLADEVAARRFRDDLFFRIAVALIKLPPLRARKGDFTLLVDHLLDRFNTESAADPAWEEKTLSPSARNLLQRHDWPGNIRELANTLTRAAVWSTSSTITEQDVGEALLELPISSGNADGILNRPIENGVDLPDLLQQVAKHYLSRALEATAGNKSRTAELLGLSSYQTLTNWLKKYGLSG
ncbi:MAG: sigma 54-interacting transcriptional regulator [Candidatus Thiodiazotropha sp. (ex Ctena orbiculata)]|uniref:Sigma 54-interacting transcriptional regulator n=1 Tax=Candidatus Thiodiazotropha taylori TaxID=2792791 RepID=A0A944QUB5_9GAMM|nr:sigma 54-interacting transcriptional regulator [Candidatus Thiodiazotropha taylori]